MKFLKLSLILFSLSACNTTSTSNQVELPFLQTSHGDCHRINTNIANYKHNGKCIVSKITVSVSFGKNLNVQNLDGLKCEAVGAATQGIFVPPAVLRVPQPMSSSEPLTVACSIGEYQGSATQYPKKVNPEAIGYLFIDDRMHIVVK